MKNISNILNNFKHYSYLMTQLISRDFKRKYKRSVLGIVWSLLYPILMMTVMAVVFSHMFKFSVEGINYIPKYIFPIAKCLFVGINFILTLIPWLGLIILTKFGLGTYPADINMGYLLLPYIFICFLIFTIGVGLFLSCISVFLRDVFYIYGIVLTIWNYFTPVFYSITILPKSLQKIFVINPIYHYITSVREIVLYGSIPSILKLGLLALIAIASLLVGAIIFKKNQDKFIYYI